MTQPRLTIVPLTFRASAAFVAELHRHNKPPRGCKFCIGVCDEVGKLRGVAMIGRPVARHYDDGLTAEVNRTCTDGCPNANSALYGAAWRICAAMGYRRLVTYTQADETGASLTAAGWVKVREIPPRKGWADSSVAMRALRDPVGNGGVARTLWRVTNVTPTEIRARLDYAWLPETSSSPDDWSPERPSLGQCAVTALIVQDELGGDLLRVVVRGVSHYYNRLPDGSTVDLTRQQFPIYDPSEPEVRSRDYVLSFPATRARYKLLRRRFLDDPAASA